MWDIVDCTMGKLTSLLGLLLVALLLSGCVNLHTIRLRNPNTDQIRVCPSQGGFGLLDAISARAWQDACVKEAKDAGYTEECC